MTFANISAICRNITSIFQVHIYSDLLTFIWLFLICGNVTRFQTQPKTISIGDRGKTGKIASYTSQMLNLGDSFTTDRQQ